MTLPVKSRKQTSRAGYEMNPAGRCSEVIDVVILLKPAGTRGG
jgi:hypothetical protein